MAIEPHVNNKGLIEELSKATENKNHESLTNLMGGSSEGHYHLTDNEHDKLSKIIEAIISEDSADVEINHEKLAGLLGGSETGGHYHLTEALLERLRTLQPRHIEWLEFISSTLKISAQVNKEDGYPVIDHRKLDHLEGGDASSGKYYHLTNDELKKLQRLINFAFEDSDVVIIPHSDLKNVLPYSSYQYHLNESQYNTLKDWINNGRPSTGSEANISIIDSVDGNAVTHTDALSAYQGYFLNYWKVRFVEDIDEESWTFTLEDGSTVTKNVALWTSTGSARLSVRR